MVDGSNMFDTYKELIRESVAERKDALEVLEMLWGKRDFECLDVGMQVLDLAPTDYREDIWRLVKDIRNRHYQ